MMEKILFWEKDEKHFEDGRYHGIIITKPDEVFDAVSTVEFPFMVWPDIPGSKAAELGLPAETGGLEESELEELANKIVGCEGEWASGGQDEICEISNCLAFDFNNKVFFNLAHDVETFRAYGYFKNTNWVVVALDENTAEYEIEILDSYSLDIWDGSNHYYPRKSTGNHAILEKVLADSEPALLWHEWSQWNGDELDSGYLVSKDEALETLKDHPEIDEIREWLSK